MSRPSYGLDAPPLVKQFLVVGAFSIIAYVLGHHVLIDHNSAFNSHHHAMVLVILALALLVGAVHLIFAALMCYSSLIGKKIMRNKIISELGLHGREKVLDVGCGRGLLLIGAAEKLNSKGMAVGIDIWSDEDQSNNNHHTTIQNAIHADVYDRIELVTGDMTDMEFKTNSFDAVISSMAIHNIQTEYGRKKAISEIARVLKPGGRLILIDFQKTQEYKHCLQDLEWEDVTRSRKHFVMFPPVRIVRAIKPTKG